MAETPAAASSAQCTSAVLMVRPACFGFNPETAASNDLQQQPALPAAELAALAQAEFDGFVSALRAEGVAVYVAEGSAEPCKPDALFPNNWVSLHSDGTVVLYPMLAPNRRLERQLSFIKAL